jgi:hypothetical protein
MAKNFAREHSSEHILHRREVRNARYHILHPNACYGHPKGENHPNWKSGIDWKKYHHRPEVIKRTRETHKKWCQTHRNQRRESSKRWQKNHPEWKEKYWKENRKTLLEKNKQWIKDHPEWKKAKDAKRRNLGSIPFNKYFVGSEAHHIDKDHIVYIPKELHTSIWHCLETGKGMFEINAKAFEWLGNQQLVGGSLQTNLPKLEAQPLNSTVTTVVQE